MTQTFKYSSGFSLHLQHPGREQGFLLSLQLPKRQILKIINQDYNANNKYREFSATNFQLHRRVLKAVVKATGDNNQFGQNFGDTTSEHKFVSQPKDDHKVTPHSELWRECDTFYRFCRLYSVIGTIISTTSVSLLPLTSVRDLSPAFFVGSLKAVIPLAFANIYSAGLNQLFDVEIDKINKPYLPLASGEFSMEKGKTIVAAFGLMCLAMGIMFQSPPLFVGILVYFLLGTAYSVDLPLLRWKTKPFLAAFSLVGAELVTHLGVFYHIQKCVLGREIVFTKSLGFTVVFCSLFCVVFAIFKDIPDVDGDQEFGNRTFTIRHGKKKVFSICMTILLIGYGSAVVIGASSSLILNRLVCTIGHCTMAAVLWVRAKSLNLDDKESVQSFYMFLWKLYYAEHVLIHFVR